MTHDGRSTFRARFDGSTGSLIVSRAPEWNCTLTNGRFERLEGLRVFVIVPAASQVIRAYCGGWSGTGSSGGDFGVLGLLIDGSTVIGVAASPSDGDKAADVVEGSYSAGGGIAISIPSYIFTGETSRYAIFGAYESTLDGRRSGSWTVGPCSF